MTEALAEEGVKRIASTDVRDTPSVAHNLDCRRDSLQAQLAVQLGQRSAQQVIQGSGRQRSGGSGRDAESIQPERHLLAVGFTGIFPTELSQKLLQLADYSLRTGQLDPA